LKILGRPFRQLAAPISSVSIIHQLPSVAAAADATTTVLAADRLTARHYDCMCRPPLTDDRRPSTVPRSFAQIRAGDILRYTLSVLLPV